MMKNLKPYVSAIVACAHQQVIGYQSRLPWHLPADLQHFKQLTVGQIVIMGRKTYDSIGRPLPNRLNIIISRDVNFSANNCLVFSSIAAALAFAGEQLKEIFIIGGAEIYQQSLPLIHRIYLTRIDYECPGDAYFPELKPTEWQILNKENFKADAKNPYKYTFLTLERTRD